MLPEKFRGSIKSPCCTSVLSVCQSVCRSVRTSRICVWPITSLFEVGFYNYFTEMITILRWWVARNIWVATLKVKVLAAKSCPAHNFVIWSLTLQLFHRNDHSIEVTWREQHLGRYLEGQGHSMTLQQNRVRPITSLFEARFYNYFIKMITILRRVTCNIWVATLKAKGTAWHCSKIVSGP
jgi:hypothetical protein